MIDRSVAAVVVTAIAVIAPTAQQASFRTETRLVVLHATVRNRQGIEVTDLDRNAFTVYEDGQRQSVTLFRRDDIPVSIGLLIDNSGSMRTLRSRVERAAVAFVRASNPLDEACVVNFADTPHMDVPLTSDAGTLATGIGRIDSIGGTALRDAVDMGEAYLRDHASRDRRVLLVITDGRDNASQVTAGQIETLSRQSDTAVYAVGIFASASSPEAATGRRELDALTRRTGGAAYYPSSVDEIDAIVADLAAQIRRQYTIAYASTNQVLDGRYRKIRVEARGREPLKVQTRAGYVARSAGDR